MSSSKKKAAPTPPKFTALKDTLHLAALETNKYTMPNDTLQLIPKTKNTDSESSSLHSSTSEMRRLGESQENHSFMAINGPAPQQEETSVKTPYTFGGNSPVARAYGLTDNNESDSTRIPGTTKPEEIQMIRSFEGGLGSTVNWKKEDSGLSRDNYAFQESFYDDAMTPKIKPRDLSDDSDEEESDKFKPARGSGMFKSPLTASKESVRSTGSAGSSFTPVDPMYGNGPSDDMSRKLDDLSQPGSSNNWDTADSNPSDSIHIIPQTTREATPDSTASSGNRIFGSFGAEQRGVRFDNLRSTTRENRQSPVDTASRGNMVMRNLGGTTRDNIRTAVGEQETSFSLGASGSGRNGDAASTMGHEYDTPASPSTIDLGATMRHQIREQHQGIELRPRMRQPIREHEESNHRIAHNEDYDEKKIRPLWQKCVLLFGGLAILLAGIIATVVVLRDNSTKEFGLVVDDPITHDECIVNDTDLALGHMFQFECVIDLSHDQRVKLKNISKVRLTYPDKTMVVIDVTSDNKTNWSWESSPIKATCATIGVYNLTFIAAKNMNETRVTVKLKAPTLTVSMEQFFMNATTLTSYFDTECTVAGDCNNYDVDVVGVNGNSLVNLIENKTCATTSNNNDGTYTSCRANVSESTMDSFSQLQCKVSKTGIPSISTPFRYPECGFNKTCKEEKVNCTDEDNQRKIENCQLDKSISDCFHPGRKVFSYCEPEKNICSCKMNWCQSSRAIFKNTMKNDVPIQVLCGGNDDPKFTEKPPTTTTNATSTTSDIPVSTTSTTSLPPTTTPITTSTTSDIPVSSTSTTSLPP